MKDDKILEFQDFYTWLIENDSPLLFRLREYLGTHIIDLRVKDAVEIVYSVADSSIDKSIDLIKRITAKQKLFGRGNGINGGARPLCKKPEFRYSKQFNGYYLDMV